MATATQIFICYRRSDTAAHAGRLYDALCADFGKDAVFMDLGGIEPGDDYANVIDARLASCAVLIAVIGRQWQAARLANAGDYVRREIGGALARRIRVIPLLVNDATLPAAEDLPEDVRELVRRQMLEMTNRHWHSDYQQLAKSIQKDVSGRTNILGGLSVGTASLSPRIRKYRDSLLSFVITLALGLAPLWGGKIIPGFRSILDALPESLQDVIPWASLLMSTAAVCVEFFGGKAIDDKRLTPALLATFGALVIVTFASYFAYNATVIRVRVPGANTTVAYLVGATPLPSCECAKRALDIRECIGRAISVNPDDVAACYPLQEIQTRKAILAALYLLLMLLLGILIGILVLKKDQPNIEVSQPA